MQNVVRTARITTTLALTVVVLMTGRRWDANVITQLALALATAAAVVGFGAPILVTLLTKRLRAIVDEAVQNVSAELRALLSDELALIRDEFEQAMQSAREDGQMDGVLRERLGRLAGDPPRPGRRRAADRMADTSSHLRPIRDDHVG